MREVMRRRTLRKRCFHFSLVLLVVILVACQPNASRPLQDKIREYIYDYQPTTGVQFVQWAEKELTSYSSRQIHEALHEEGKFQAELGHPNSVGVLSFAAQAWAQHNGFDYDPIEWTSLQQEAMGNMRSDPGILQIWPPSDK